MTSAILKLSRVHVAYGGIKAVKGIDLEVREGELVALIGANGAGKSTTLRAIAGLLPAQQIEGDLMYAGQAIKDAPAFELVQRGLSMVPEGRGVFARMTIHENLLMGAYTRTDQGAIASDADKWYEIFPRLKERATQLAGTLSGGEQQMLAMARSLMSCPKLLLLDEPSMGLAPLMVEKIFEVIRAVSAQGVSILLVEQNAKLALQTASRAYVMDSGLIPIEGTSDALLNDDRVRAAYLGE